MSGSHSRQKLDLPRQRYGHLTVLSPAENVGTRTAWRCLGGCARFEDAVKAWKNAGKALHDNFLREIAQVSGTN